MNHADTPDMGENTIVDAPKIALGLRTPGRAALSNNTGRFEANGREPVFDGWDIPYEDRALRTTTRIETPRSIISRNTSPDLPFDRSLNPYRGCEHGCIYCYARPSHAFLGLSPGLDFETQLIARPGAAAQLERELSAAKYSAEPIKPIAIGTNTDPYQPIEAEHRVMRECLQVLAAFNHPVTITTKGTLIERDIDILSGLAAKGLVGVAVSMTTLSSQISRQIEPRAPGPARRLKMIARLSEAGIPTRVLLAPVVPALTDHEIEAILKAAAGAGARSARMIMLRLPREVAPLFVEWLEAVMPDRAARIMGRVRELHGGRDYDPEFGKRMRGEGAFAELAAQRFDLAARRLGLDKGRGPLRCDLFAVPPRAGDQLSLF